MKPFEYAAPKSLDEALGQLGEKWGETEIMAGGTDLVTCLKQDLVAPKRLVSLRNIPDLRGISVTGEAVRVGASTTLEELAAHEAIKKHFPALVTAVEGIGSPQILSIGTVAGDLCQRPRCWYYRGGFGLFGKQGDKSLVVEGDNRYHAIFANDGPAYYVHPSSLAPALIALGATVTAMGPGKKKREIAAAEFFQVPKTEQERETVLKPNEIVTEIRIPIKGLANATYEIRHRHGLDWPYVTATVAFLLKDGRASDSRVVLGHVAPVPWRVPKAAEILSTAKLDAALAGKCGDAAASGAKPLSKNKYKVQLVKSAVKRALLAAAGIQEKSV